MRRMVPALLAIACSMAVGQGVASAQQRFVGQVAGGGANCVTVALDIVVDGSRVSGGGTLAVASRTPVTVSGTRSGDGVDIRHPARRTRR